MAHAFSKAAFLGAIALSLLGYNWFEPQMSLQQTQFV